MQAPEGDYVPLTVLVRWVLALWRARHAARSIDAEWLDMQAQHDQRW